MRAALATLLGVLVAACGSPTVTPGQVGGTISVFAAASLTDSFQALASSFQKVHSGALVKFNFAGTPTLVTQIEQGAEADVFASADTANMDRLEGGALTAGSSKVFAHNQLEIVVARGNPKGITSLVDLARPGVIYITEAATVPAGKYSLQALQKAGVTVKPKSLESDVKSVLTKIELGEADAGIVYATDVKAAGDRVSGIPIPDRYNVVATYPMVTVRGSKHPDLANAFIDYALSAPGQATLASFGFQPA